MNNKWTEAAEKRIAEINAETQKLDDLDEVIKGIVKLTLISQIVKALPSNIKAILTKYGYIEE
jgi:hypothetical protein